MSSTKYYNLAIFDRGDRLDNSLNIRKEQDRFTAIDNQLYALFKIFGNGVINGWNVQANTGLSVIVSPGLGIIGYVGSQTLFPANLTLSPNSTNYIYVI